VNLEENIVAPEVAEAAQAGGQQEAVPAADQVEQPAAEEQEQKQEPTAEQKRIKYLERQNRVRCASAQRQGRGLKCTRRDKCHCRKAGQRIQMTRPHRSLAA
jgi:hypothetical protein